MTLAPRKKKLPTPYLRMFSVIHASITLLLIILAVTVYWMGDNRVIGFPENGNIFMYLVPLIAIVGYFGGHYLFNLMVIHIPKENNLHRKITQYGQASILRFLFLAVAIFLGILAYYLDNNVFYLTISAVLIVSLVNLRPKKGRTIRDLDLNEQEQAML